MEPKKIVIKGARQHNLKGIDLEIPRGQLVVITGPSGSGKSSLAFDTIYAEGQRRYVESLSPFARQFLDRMEKPDVELITGLSPAIALEQKASSRNPRSTVGTATEIHDYLRLLYARVGTPHCHGCGEPISSQTVHQIVDLVMNLPSGSRFQILAPIVRGQKGTYRRELQEMQRQGFVRVRVDGKIQELSAGIKLAESSKLKVGWGLAPPQSRVGPCPTEKGDSYAIELEKGQPHDIQIVVDRMVVKDSIRERLTDSVELALKLADGFALILIDPDEELLFSQRPTCLRCRVGLPELSPRLFSFNSPYGACPRCDGLGIIQAMAQSSEKERDQRIEEPQTCPDCKGGRLRSEAAAVTVGGLSLIDLCRLSLQEAREFFHILNLDSRKRSIGEPILREIRERLGFLVEVGLGYLTLEREAGSLSGGEGQRVRLATQVGSRLTGLLYVLDEPSVGLHPRDNHRLLATLRELKELGNTVIVVEHDRETILSADYVVDLGPGAGVHGGYLVAAGPPEEIRRNPSSLTGRYLGGEIPLSGPKERRRPDQGFLVIRGARHHNLKGIDVAIPLCLFVCVTGVSGSGKSTLLLDILYRALAQRLHRARERPGRFYSLEGIEKIDKVIRIDQAPIGRTPRSNPATYTGVFAPVRELFAQVPEARRRGYGPSRFSFNIPGGRCEACQGDGLIRIEMHFLPDIYVTCQDCRGKRFNQDTLEVRYKGKTIADVLELTVEQSLSFFQNIPSVRHRLQTLCEVGLGYLHLGQPATTLSGGEAQRIKLSRELGRQATGHTVYILDEPTTGLHFADIRQLLAVLNRLVEMGNTVVVIEHNLDVIYAADYVIDLGPEGGELGGKIVAVGPPEEIALEEASHTGRCLREMIPAFGETITQTRCISN